MCRIVSYSIVMFAVVLQGQLTAGDPIRMKAYEDRVYHSQFGKTVFEYVAQDKKVLRPYFHLMHTPSEISVTRLHPPIEGAKLSDHPTMHPGLWMAFGNISGHDFWRNKGRVRQLVGPGQKLRTSFSVKNAYVADDKVICNEVCDISVHFVNSVHFPEKCTLIVWTSTFEPVGDSFYFGDQEEMGLGIRVPPWMAVVNGGTIRDSKGRKNEKEVWGKQADWCEYTGIQDGKRAGIVIMPDPRNFRRSWFHARDYGLLVANPFGRNAFTKGEKSRVEVKSGWLFRLRYGILLYDCNADETADIAARYRDYCRIVGVNKRN